LLLLLLLFELGLLCLQLCLQPLLLF